MSLFPDPTSVRLPTSLQSTGERLIDDVRACSPRPQPGDTRAERLIASFLASLCERPADEPLAALLQDAAGLSDLSLVGPLLLRLVQLPQAAFLVSDGLRAELMKVFDRAFATPLYKELQLTTNSQAHAKLDALTASLVQSEREYEQALSATWAGLERVGAVRAGLARILGPRAGRTLLLPWLPDSLIQRLSDAAEAVNRYLENREDFSVMERFSTAIELLDQLDADLLRVGNRYSRTMRENLVVKAHKTISEDFARNRFTRPGDVIVTSADKKYPLHTPGAVGLVLTVANCGEGYVHDVELSVVCDHATVERSEIQCGRIAPDSARVVTVDAVTAAPLLAVSLIAEVRWKDFDGTRRNKEFSVAVDAQRSDVDWEGLRLRNPYSLEPAESDEQLVGRREVVDRLVALTSGSVESAMIHGQKRVGKTSIAKALQSRLKRENHIVVYVESGEYVRPDPTATLNGLVSRVTRAIQRSDARLSSLPLPATSDSLLPLVDFIEDVQRVIPSARVVIILDEFDSLPKDLYSRGELGNAFFLNLRSLSGRAGVGCVAVGGELMPLILDKQGMHLNKWVAVPVDYFSRTTDWGDYRELVCRPVEGFLEYTDGAVSAIYDVTAGNPYFTNVVCRSVFQRAVRRHDCYVTERDVAMAIEEAIAQTERNAFQHFWDDRIVDSGEAADARSVARRRILIAVCDVLGRGSPCTAQAVKEHDLVRGVSAVDLELQDFVERRILLETSSKEFLFKVPLFFQWLRSRGVHDIIASFSETDAELRRRQQDEEARISSEEIVALTARWPPYRGERVTTDHVRAWLEQFSGAREQRLMMNLLHSVRFFPNTFVRQKLAEVRGIVERVSRKRYGSPMPLAHVVVSYLDGAAKSGAAFARLLAEELGVRAEDVIERTKLKQALLEKEVVRGVLFVDDFVGTGGSAEKGLRALHSEFGEIVRARDVMFLFCTVVAFHEGWTRVQSVARELAMGIEPHCCEMLEESDRLFSPTAPTFNDGTDREHAKELAASKGALLEKHHPLGYGDYGLGVVFERGCPNNSLPILWAESSRPKWIPLFRRL